MGDKTPPEGWLDGLNQGTYVMTDTPTPAVSDEGLVERTVAAVLQDVCELPDYNSPDDQPDLLQCTTDELSMIVERHVRAALGLPE